MKINRLRNLTLSLVLTGLATFAIVASAAIEPDFKTISNKYSEGVVTVKFILSVSMGGGMAGMDQESETEMTCVMATADGLVLCSNNQLTGFTAMLNQFTGGSGVSISAKPKELKVILGSTEKTFDAEIVTKDSDLDLVWIKIKNTENIKFKYIDFNTAKVAEVGDKLLIMRRLGNYFGREITINENRVGGITSKPRTLYIPAFTSMPGGGLPVFSSSGDIIGLMITQLPESDGSQPSLMGMMVGNLQDGMSGLILPAAEVIRATKRAMKQEK